MAHPAQRAFFEQVRRQFPESFTGVRVLDCGSLNVNGVLRDLFTESDYTGVDIASGGNVDVVAKVHELPYGAEFDTIVSGEMLEHDEHWLQSLRHMYEMLAPGGLLAISAAGEGRAEHGTTRTGANWGTSADYYGNLTEANFAEAFDLPAQFSEYAIERNDETRDIYFWGIKRNAHENTNHR